MKWLSFFVLFTIFSCEFEKVSTPQEKQKSLETKRSYTFQTFETTDFGWGYCIFKGEKKILNQPHIPAVQGNRGFQSQEDAKKVAKLVVKKINQGNFPPTVSEQEMLEIGVRL
ncbi:MAG: DUF4907 domain-containing protein [Lishizhenia sp.]